MSTLYHVGAHAHVSNYVEYDQWLKNKSFEKGWNVINFIEDIKVDGFLKENHPVIWQNMIMIKMLYDTYYENLIHSNSKFSGIENTKKDGERK